MPTETLTALVMSTLILSSSKNPIITEEDLDPGWRQLELSPGSSYARRRAGACSLLESGCTTHLLELLTERQHYLGLDFVDVGPAHKCPVIADCNAASRQPRMLQLRMPTPARKKFSPSIS